MKLSLAKVGLCVATIASTALGVAALGTIAAQGSDSTIGLVKALTKAHTEAGGATFTVEGGGSSKGAKACIEGKAALSFLSRELKKEETEAGLIGHAYAKDAVAIVVNKSNSLDEITIEQLKDIFTGKTDKWPNGEPVTAFNRNEDSGTRELFAEKVLGGKDVKFGEKVAVKHDGVLMSSVAKIPSSVGYTSFGEVNDTVKVLKIAGVAPSNETILSGKYPLTRTLTFATKGEPSAEIKAFFAFIDSAAGQKLVTANHYVPLASTEKK